MQEDLSQSSIEHGYSGVSFFDIGYIFAPYVPLLQTPTIDVGELELKKFLIREPWKVRWLEEGF